MKVLYSGGRSTSGSNRFETFETQQIHVKALYGAGLLAVDTHQNHLKLPYSLDTLVIIKYRNTSNSCETTLLWWSTSGLNRFKTLKTHQIHVKLHYSAGLVVVRRNSKILQKQSSCKSAL